MALICVQLLMLITISYWRPIVCASARSHHLKGSLNSPQFFPLTVLEILAAPHYMKFVSNAANFPPEDYYDYIVIGGGTAGCPLAATLSHNYTVLLLERGGTPQDFPFLTTQEGFLNALTHVDMFHSPVQTFTSEDGVPNARGRVLGGSSAINAGFYSRADQDFFPKSGVNWDLNLANKSYSWVEKNIVFRPNLKDWQSALRDSLLEAGAGPYNGFDVEHKIGTKIGGTTFDSSGCRHSAANLLDSANSDNLKIAVHASVERILLASVSKSQPYSSQTSAIGVVYRDENGSRHHAMVRASGEIILSAGAIGSPQLLLLSGIGPRRYLASMRIQLAHHLPYVGKFMYDNPRNGISIIPPVPLQPSLIQVVGITKIGAYIEAASSVIRFSPPPHSPFIRVQNSPLYLTIATLMEKIVGPLSSGSLRLASTDVRINPRVRFNYFSNQADLERCVNGTRKIAEIMKSRTLNEFKVEDWFGGRRFRFVGAPLPDDEDDFIKMAEFCKRTVSTIWHYHGGCLVGKVVDGEYRVLGVRGLRVVDGSTLTISPGTNPQATLMMMGRYMGLKIVKDRGGG